MITTEEIVGLLDVHHLIGLCDEDSRLLESALAERCSTHLLDAGAWAPVQTEPAVLDWINIRGMRIGQDVDLWVYQVEQYGMWWCATCSGPNGEYVALARTDAWPKSQLVCEQHRRSRRAAIAAAPVTSSG